MRHPCSLRRLTLAAIDYSKGLPKPFITDRIAAIPKLRIVRFVEHFLQGPAQLAILDLPKQIPTKLEINPVLIDREAPASLNIYSIFRIGNQFCRCKRLGTGQ